MSMGFNVLIAEDGTRHSEKDLRFKCIRALMEHATTMTESQSVTSSEDLHSFPTWDIPLAFGDSRPLDEIDLWADELPSWAEEEEVEEEEEEEGTAPQEEVPPQQGQPQPKKMPRPDQGHGASASSSAQPKVPIASLNRSMGRIGIHVDA